MTVEPKIEIPFDTELEQSILGKMLAYPNFIDIAAGEIEARHFHEPLHQRMFDMIVYLSSEGDVTPTLVGAVMKSDPTAANGWSIKDYILNMAAAAPSITNMRVSMGQLKDLALRRRLHEIGGGLAEIALHNPENLDAKDMSVGFLEELLATELEEAAHAETPYEIGLRTVKELEDAKAGRIIPVIKTGIGPLDLELGGFRGGDFVTILGKSGMGKSALMCLLARLLASSGVAVIFFSLEMKRDQLVQRMVCDLDFDTAEKPLPYSRVRNHNITDEEFKRFVLANQLLDGLPLEIVDDDGLTMTQITARARAFKAKHKGKRIAVIGDYLQIVEPYDARENRERQVARIARGAKSLAKRLDCPSIWGSQMNEADEARRQEERRPRASDARESRGIMNESDLMLAPWRAVVAVENRKPLGVNNDHPDMIAWFAELREAKHKFELLALKNRHGKRFDLSLWADMSANAIRDAEPERGPPPGEEQGLLI